MATPAILPQPTPMALKPLTPELIDPIADSIVVASQSINPAATRLDRLLEQPPDVRAEARYAARAAVRRLHPHVHQDAVRRAREEVSQLLYAGRHFRELGRHAKGLVAHLADAAINGYLRQCEGVTADLLPSERVELDLPASMERMGA